MKAPRWHFIKRPSNPNMKQDFNIIDILEKRVKEGQWEKRSKQDITVE